MQKSQLCCWQVLLRYITVEDLKIADDTISWSDRLKYLGVHFKPVCILLIDSEVTMCKFYAAANVIYVT